MPAEPLVSLLIPTFNSALTIAEAIASCQQQTHRNLEIIVYDETSKDGTREIIQAIAAKDPRIRIMLSDKNSGPVQAWRVLLHEAKGKYFTWVWADDLILPKFVESLVAILEKNPTHVIAGANAYSETLPETVAGTADSKIVTGEKSRCLLHYFDTRRVKGDVLALGILAAVFPVSQICYLVKTEAGRDVFDHYMQFENPYGFDFTRRAYGNDVSYASELGLRSGEVEMLGEPLAVCRASPESMTVNARRDHRWQYWLQYVWAIRIAWRRCRDLSPRMDSLIRVVDDRVSFCETVYALKIKRMPKEFCPFKSIRALWFLKFHDRRMNQKVGAESLEAYLAARNK